MQHLKIKNNMKKLLLLTILAISFNVYSQTDSLKVFEKSTVFGLTDVTSVSPDITNSLNFSIEHYFEKGGYISVDINNSISITGHKYFNNGIFIGSSLNSDLQVFGIVGYSYEWISIKGLLSPMNNDDPIEMYIGILTELSIPITNNGTIYTFYDLNTISDNSTVLYHIVGIGFKYQY
jgi:hypothetical protein